jgi:hypothetical protein
MSLRVALQSRTHQQRDAMVFFNASTRLSGLSQNAGFSLLTSWILRISGTPVIHFVCKAGMVRCVLGTDENNISQPMPCGMCLRQSRVNVSFARRKWFEYQADDDLKDHLEKLDLSQLLAFELPSPFLSINFPLGSIILPSLRWRLRRYSLVDDEQTRAICRDFMLSAWSILKQFQNFLDKENPQAVVLFNGTHFPEATVVFLCRQKNIRVITHESGFQPLSGYFVEGEATRYPIVIPDVELTKTQDTCLDTDLHKRWQGDFSMAGIHFFSNMEDLPDTLTEKIQEYEQVVSLFSNVIFDTTQMYANTVFSSMFSWLDELLPVISGHPHTLFIIRAHPDESRSGKASRESVTMWYEQNAAILPNVQFITPGEKVNSYALVNKSKFVLTLIPLSGWNPYCSGYRFWQPGRHLLMHLIQCSSSRIGEHIFTGWQVGSRAKRSPCHLNVSVILAASYTIAHTDFPCPSVNSWNQPSQLGMSV